MARSRHTKRDWTIGLTVIALGLGFLYFIYPIVTAQPQANINIAKIDYSLETGYNFAVSSFRGKQVEPIKIPVYGKNGGPVTDTMTYTLTAEGGLFQDPISGEFKPSITNRFLAKSNSDWHVQNEIFKPNLDAKVITISITAKGDLATSEVYSEDRNSLRYEWQENVSEPDNPYWMLKGR